MIEALILICTLGVSTADCTPKTAEDITRVKVASSLPISCFMAAEVAIAGMPGERAKDRVLKVICQRG
jgi:hypothetical protein